MSTATDEALRAGLAQKLHPTRIRTSNRFVAILAYMLGETWTDPVINDIRATSDGHLIAYDVRGDARIGDVVSLRHNCIGIARQADLSEAEERFLLDRAASVGRCP